MQIFFVRCFYHKIIVIITTTSKEGIEETFGSNGYVYGIDCGDRFKGIYLSPNSSIYIH